MSGMPAGLDAWRAHLSGLTPQVVGALAPWLPRLASLVGPLAPRAAEPGGDPDGYRGLDRKAAWHRLPPTAWLLAAEAPEEFLRRAAMSEHLFYDLERRQPAGQRASLLLFDAGPDSLGGPRIAHLALLVVFAARAAAATADFRWSLLQEPSRWGRGATKRDVLALLEARSPRRAAVDLRPHGIAAGDADVWVVGPPRLRGALPSGVGLLAVSEPLTLDAPLLEVTRHTPAAPSRAVTLPLPPPATRARILTRPFPPPPTPLPKPLRTVETRHVEAALLPGFLFNQSSLRLLGIEAGEVAVGMRVPVRQERRQWVHRLRAPEGQRIAALDWNRRGMAALLTEGREWTVLDQHGGILGSGTAANPLGVKQMAPDGRVSELFCLPTGDPQAFWAQVAFLRVFAFRRDGPAAQTPALGGVLALARASGRVVAVARAETDESTVELTARLGDEAPQRIATLPARTRRAWLGYGCGFLPELSVVAQGEEADRVRVGRLTLSGDPWTELRLPGAPEIWGATADPADRARAGVLVSDPGGRFLRVEGERGLRLTVPHVDARVVYACTAPSLPLVAWLGDDGATRVVDMKRRAVLLVARPERVP